MDIYELAELMHSKLCHWDHTEGCSWYYYDKRMVKWTDSFAHKKWLNKANKLVLDCGMSIDDIAKVVSHIER